MLGTSKSGRFGSPVIGKRGIGRSDVGRPVVFDDRIDAHRIRQRTGAGVPFRSQISGHRHPVGQSGLGLVGHVGIARKHRSVPAGWPGALWVMLRTIVNLSAIFACMGNSSVICIPGTLVEIVSNGPRYSLATSGFGS